MPSAIPLVPSSIIPPPLSVVANDSIEFLGTVTCSDSDSPVAKRRAAAKKRKACVVDDADDDDDDVESKFIYTYSKTLSRYIQYFCYLWHMCGLWPFGVVAPC
jgi:hypothetical protein